MDNASARQAGAAFEAMLLQSVLAPLTRECEVLGDYGSLTLAQTIAQRDGCGFGVLLAKELEGAP